MVFVTGDMHGTIDIYKLGLYKRWRPGYKLTKQDYLIIAGDFGVIWHGLDQDGKPLRDERRQLNYLNKLPYTVLFVDGNHENHARLAQLPTRPMFKGTVGMAADSVFHLRRGEVYEIDGKRFFTFGGALSIDKSRRVPGRSWWAEEIPSKEEMAYGTRNLERANWAVDYVIAHTIPTFATGRFINSNPIWDPTSDYLSFVAQNTTFNTFVAGHWHEDTEFNIDGKKYIVLYNKVIQLI